MSCACFFSSVTVSQCHRGGAGGLQLVKGLLLTVDRRGLQYTVYSKSTAGQRGSRGSTVYSRSRGLQ